MSKSSLQLKSTLNRVSVQFYDEKIVRVCYNKNLENRSDALIGAPEVDVEIEYGKRIWTRSMNVEVEPNTLKVKIRDANFSHIVKSNNIDLKKLSISLGMGMETAFYGCGEHYTFINLMNTELENWNTDVIGVAPLHSSIQKAYHTAINFYIGRGEDFVYGVYFDNSHRTNFKFSEEGVTFQSAGGALDFYVITGDSVAEIISGYTSLTGKAPLPRRDFLGYQQCRWSYENRVELMEVAKRMRAEQIPCDVLYLDIDYMQDFKVFTVNNERFPDFKEMVYELDEMGFKLVVIIDPGVKQEEGYKPYEQGEKAEYFLKETNSETYIGSVWPGKAAFPDFNREEVRIWWGNLHKELIKAGVAGIWCDMNEPSDMSTASKTVPEDVFGIDSAGKICPQKEYHNLYGFGQAKATYEGLKKLTTQRPFVLTRAAFAGSQRYSAIWAGDNSSLWEHLEASIPMLLNLGLSGFAFTGADVGGFMKNTNGELLARWTQLGAFIPFFRNHTEKFSAHQEPWCFGEEITNICRKFINLRYSLTPHIYNLFYQHTQTGEPIIRPIFYSFQNDTETHNISDQFMLGDSILLAPIIRPKTQNRLTYLPRGTWFEWEKSTPIEGGRYIISSAKLAEMPIYVKAGSIVPRNKIMNYEGETADEITLDIYPGDYSEYTLYWDNGLDFKYEKGEYSLVKFHWEKGNLIQNFIKDNYPLPPIKQRIIQ